ncbi:MAG TPA: hypothetical protein VJ936_08365, partial [Desulfobacteraceae bacterium]|nr:hypothetical protein [Desulfobacteraceae bacterium]
MRWCVNVIGSFPFLVYGNLHANHNVGQIRRSSSLYERCYDQGRVVKQFLSSGIPIVVTSGAAVDSLDEIADEPLANGG